jgi:hypothetical protein
MELVIKVVDVKGTCPVYKLGDKITKGGHQKRMYNALILAKSRVGVQCVSRCQESRGDDSGREKEITTHLPYSIPHLVTDWVLSEV